MSNVIWKPFDVNNIDIPESPYKSDAVDSEEVEIKLSNGEIHKAIFTTTTKSIIAIAIQFEEGRFESITDSSDAIIMVEEGEYTDGDYTILEWRPIVDMHKIVDELQGTCNDLSSACQTMGLGDESELTMDELTFLDDEIFLCDECGWWFEISEQSSDGENCCDCNDEDDEDE